MTRGHVGSLLALCLALSVTPWLAHAEERGPSQVALSSARSATLDAGIAPALDSGLPSASEASRESDGGPADGGTASDASSEPDASTAPASAVVPERRIADFRVSLQRGLSWDLNLEGGLGVALGAGKLDQRWLGRARLGLLLANEPFFLALGVVGELGGLVGHGAGLQIETLDFYTGLSAHGGVVYGGHGAYVTHVGVGLAIFSVEWAHAFEEHPDARNALYFKLHVPIGIVAMML